MARDILGEFGPESKQPQVSRATSGGRQQPRDVRNYQPPQGPTNINDPKGPGLHGANYGNTGTQPRAKARQDANPEGGSPGLHGESHGNKGSQR